MSSRSIARITYYLTAFLIPIFFFGILLSVASFFVGYHQADLGQNIRYLNAEYDLDLQELDPPSTGLEMYSKGINLMIHSFIGFGYFMILLPILFYSMSSLNKKYRFEDD